MAKYTLPPRQKMTNLLYVVLIAMLAINISSDVLEGYVYVNCFVQLRIAKVNLLPVNLLAAPGPEVRSYLFQLVQFPRKHISYLIQLKKDIPKTENVQKIRICIL